MIARAIIRYIRISPRKFRLIVPLVKGKHPEAAIDILRATKKKASTIAIDLIESAYANAKRKQGVDAASLYISNLIADCGPQMKRFRAGSMGRAGMIRKRTSHVTVTLDARSQADVTAAAAAAAAAIGREKAPKVTKEASKRLAHAPAVKTAKKG